MAAVAGERRPIPWPRPSAALFPKYPSDGLPRNPTRPCACAMTRRCPVSVIIQSDFAEIATCRMGASGSRAEGGDAADAPQGTSTVAIQPHGARGSRCLLWELPDDAQLHVARFLPRRAVIRLVATCKMGKRDQGGVLEALRLRYGAEEEDHLAVRCARFPPSSGPTRADPPHFPRVRHAVLPFNRPSGSATSPTGAAPGAGVTARWSAASGPGPASAPAACANDPRCAPAWRPASICAQYARCGAVRLHATAPWPCNDPTPPPPT